MKKRLFGLIGKSLEHSFSPSYFSEKFRQEGIEDAEYRAFPLQKVREFEELLQEHPELNGLNVTIPYKETIISFLEELSPTAERIGAVNTIRLRKGIREGFNTDVEGFRKDLEPLLGPEHRRALILGTGGASAAVAHALDELGFELLYVSREPEGELTIAYEALSPEKLAEQDLIVNSTPLGTWPNTQEAPPIPYEGITEGSILYDLIYNPSRTLFLQKGEAQGALVRNGYGMLVGQAEAAWRIWNEA